MSVHEVDCLLESMDSVLALLGELDDSDWQAPSLCPAWRVLQVVAHLDGIEEALSGWRPAGDAAAPFEIAGKVFDEVDDWSPHQLLSRLRTVLSFRRSELLAVDTSLFDEVSWTPVGVQTYGRFMAIRNFDFWVHEQDIRVPLRRPGHTSGPRRRTGSRRGAAQLRVHRRQTRRHTRWIQRARRTARTDRRADRSCRRGTCPRRGRPRPPRRHCPDRLAHLHAPSLRKNRPRNPPGERRCRASRRQRARRTARPQPPVHHVTYGAPSTASNAR